MFGSGKNREQKKEKKMNKKSKDSVYNSKFVRLQEQKQEKAREKKQVEVNNPKTNTKKVKGKKGGGYTYIINPETNRKVSVNGLLGKQILNNYMRQLMGGSDKVSSEVKDFDCIDNRTNKSKKGKCYFSDGTGTSTDWRQGKPIESMKQKCLDNCNKIGSNPKNKNQKACNSCKLENIE